VPSIGAKEGLVGADVSGFGDGKFEGRVEIGNNDGETDGREDRGVTVGPFVAITGFGEG